MTKVIARVHPIHLSAGWPPTLRSNQSTWAVVSRKLAATIQIHHRYCYYYLNHKLICILRPTEGGRLSRPRQCSKGAQSVPKAVYRRSRYAAATAADG